GAQQFSPNEAFFNENCIVLSRLVILFTAKSAPIPIGSYTRNGQEGQNSWRFHSRFSLPLFGEGRGGGFSTAQRTAFGEPHPASLALGRPPRSRGGKRRRLMIPRRDFMTTSAAGLAVAATATPAISQRAAARTLRLVPQADLANFDPIWSRSYVARN